MELMWSLKIEAQRRVNNKWVENPDEYNRVMYANDRAL